MGRTVSSSSSAAVVRPAVQEVATRSPKPAPAKKANVFGFGVDDDGDPRRELEMLAEKQRARAQKRSSEALSIHPGEQRPSASVGGPSQGPQHLDPYMQLKKLAEWKRACGGERRP